MVWQVVASVSVEYAAVIFKLEDGGSRCLRNADASVCVCVVCVVVVCVCMCTVVLSMGGYPIAVNKYIISYHISSVTEGR